MSTLQVISPRTGEVIESVPTTPKDDLPKLVATARAAGKGWAELAMKERVRRMWRIRDAFLEAGPELASILMREGGKSEAEALTSEVLPSVNLFDYWCKAAPGFLAREKLALDPLAFPGKKAWIDYEPRGVVGLITPWNYPCSIPLRALVPALLAGNAVVWKPSELSTQIGRRLHAIFAAELPPGLLQLVIGEGDVGEALVDADVDLVSFTGSAAVGKRIAQRTAHRLIPVSLELGGKNAAVVLEDADLDRASAGIVWSAYANAGQNCAAMSRCYVVEPVAAEFKRKVQARYAAIRTGADGGELFDVPPVAAKKHLERVTRHVSEAKQAGVPVQGGDAAANGFWLQPALVEAPAAGLAITKEETFGPALSLYVVKDEAEAVARANEGDYGLTASVWTRDLVRGARVAKELDVGTITVNNASFTPTIPNAPWAGRRSSGHGTTNSHRALAELVQTRMVLVDSNTGSEFWWFPHDAQLVEVARGLMVFLSRSLGKKLSALSVALFKLPARIKAASKPVG